MRILQRCLLLLYSGIGAGVYILWHYRSRKRLIKNWMQGYSPVEKSSIPRIYKRISQYLPVFLLIEYLFSKLSGQRPSSGFRQKSTALAALTPLLDDLNDEYNYDAATIKKILLPGFIAQHDEAALCRLFFGKGGFEWDAYWDKVLEIQDKSRLQSGTESIDLNQITREKGGASVVLGWSAITNQYGGEKMAELSLHFGAFAQLLNDIFDIWKDREAGVRTPATSALDIAVLKTTCNDWATALLLPLENVEAQSFAKKALIFSSVLTISRRGISTALRAFCPG